MRGPNMSYCAFENTTLAMQQLIDMMQAAQDEGVSEFILDMSRDEAEAFRNMYEMCQRLQHEITVTQELVDAAAKAEFDAEEMDR